MLGTMLASGLHYDHTALPWWAFFAVFLAALVMILLNEHFKIVVAAALFLALSGIALTGNEAGDYAHNFINPSTIAGTSFVLVMFYIYEYCGHSFLSSRVAEALSDLEFFRHNFARKLNWLTFFASMVLDNVAAGKMAKKIAQRRHKCLEIPVHESVGITCASNAGGAASPVGDTTTIMIVAQVLMKTGMWWIVFLALPACLVYQFVMNLFIHDLPENEAARIADEGQREPLVLSRLLPLLAVPGLLVGIIVGQLLPEQYAVLGEFMPMLGLVGGFVLGAGLATALTVVGVGDFHMEWKVLASKELFKNTLFIILLLSSAHLLPVKELGDVLKTLSPDVFIYVTGLASGVFDNIPLTQYCILLGGLVWHRVAFSVGIGGNLFWLGSSCGVNVTMPEEGQVGNKVREIKVWLGPGGWTYKIWIAFTVAFVFDVVLWYGLSHLGVHLF